MSTGAVADSSEVRETRGPTVVDGWAGEGLWFLVGHPRSGTTFLGRLLGSHPRLAYWEEPDLLESALDMHHTFSRLYRHLAVDAGLDTVKLYRVSTRDQIEVSEAETKEADEKATRQVRRDVHHLQQEFLSRAGKSILLEKSPGQVLLLDSVRALFPQAKFIHIIRDPRDVASSTLRWIEREGWPPWLGAGDDPVAVVAQQWVNQVGGGLAAAAGNPAVFTLRHEDLVGSTTATLNALCEFLGLEWSTRFDAFLDHGMDTGLDPGTVGVWRNELTDAEVAAVVVPAAELMASLGYAPEDRGATPPERQRWFTAARKLFGARKVERREWVVSAHHEPPIHLVGGGIVASYGYPGGARILTDDGHVYEFPPGSAPHVGSPAEDRSPNWAGRNRHGARINGTAESFDVWDQSGQHYGPYRA